MKSWLYIKGPLTLFFGFGAINWGLYGFDPYEVQKANSEGFQQFDENDRLISMYPISYMDQFNQTGVNMLNDDTIKLITEEEATEIRDRLKLFNEEKAKKEALIPTEEDVFRSQQLLLLTEIKLNTQKVNKEEN